MPRAVDRYQLPADHDPTRSGTEVAVQRFMMDNKSIFENIWQQMGDFLNQSVFDFFEDAFGIDLKPFFDFVGGLFGWYDGKAPTFEEAIQSLIHNLLDPLTDWFNADALNASRLFGQPPAGIFNAVPWGALTPEAANLLDNPGFDSGISVQPNPDWGWDPTVYYAVPGDGSEPGSVKVTANGTTKRLFSNAVDVSPGQVFDYSVQVLALNLTGGTNPVQLWVRTDTGDEFLTSTTPAGGNAGWHGADQYALSGVLDGSYTVPESDVSWVRMLLVLDEQATGGVVWWDDALEKASQGFIGDVFDFLTDLFTLVDTFFKTLSGNATKEQLDSAWNAVLDDLGFNHPPNMEQFWHDLLHTFDGPLELLTSKEFWEHLGDLWTALWNLLVQDPSLSVAAANLKTAWNQVMTDLDTHQPDTESFWKDLCGILFAGWTSVAFTNALGVLVDTFFSALFGQADQGDLDAAWADAMDAADGLSTTSLWKIGFKAFKFLADLSELAGVTFNWALGINNTDADDITAAWNKLLSDLDIVTPDAEYWWQGVFEHLVASWTSKTFADALGSLANTYFSKLWGAADQTDLNNAWNAALLAADGLPGGSLWKYGLRAFKFFSDLNWTVTAFFTCLFSPTAANKAALNAAWDALMADIGVQNSSTDDLIANAVAAWFNPWDDLWNQIINALTGGANLGNQDDDNPDWLQRLWASLFQIPHNNVNPSDVGGVDIGDSMQQFVNQIWDAFTGGGIETDKDIPAAAQAIVDKLNEVDGRLVLIENSTGGSSSEHAPARAKYVTSKTLHSGDIPSWATHVQAVVIGGGGGGGGGLWGTAGNTGFPGTASTVKVGSAATLSGAGGAGARGDVVNWVTESYGASAGNKTYDGVLYVGGGQVKYKKVGLSPGGGGGGGEYFNFQGYGGKAGTWNYREYSLSGVSTITIHVGEGGDPNHNAIGAPVDSSGRGAFLSGRGGHGAAWLRFIKK